MPQDEQQQTDTFELDALRDCQRRWLADATPSLQGFCERAGSSQADAVNIVEILKSNLQSNADDLSTLLLDAHIFLAKQLIVNTQFVNLYLHKEKLVRSYVKRAVGKNEHDVDVDSLVTETFEAVLRKLSNGSYSYRDELSENSWLKMTARGVVSNLKAKALRHLKRIQDEDKISLTDGMGSSWATTREDRAEIGEIEPEDDIE